MYCSGLFESGYGAAPTYASGLSSPIGYDYANAEWDNDYDYEMDVVKCNPIPTPMENGPSVGQLVVNQSVAYCSSCRLYSAIPSLISGGSAYFYCSHCGKATQAPSNTQMPISTTPIIALPPAPPVVKKNPFYKDQ